MSKQTPDFDFGHGVTGEVFTSYKDGRELGIFEAHTNLKDGSRCEGVVFWDRADSTNERPIWLLACREPLTLKPSIQCSVCGNHGFITEGMWVPA